MKKLIIVLLACFILSGCSLLPKINFNTPNTVPQQTDKSKAKEICKGKAVWNEDGTLKSCSKGYYRYDENYAKKERKMTITERVKSYINSFVGWGFWGLLLVIILCPSLIGLVVGRLIEGTVGLTGKTLRSIIRGVQNARKNNADLNASLAIEMDSDTKKQVAKIKEQEKIK